MFCVFERQRYFIKKAVSYIFVCKYIKRCDFVVPGVCKACDEVVLDWGGNVNRVFLIFILVKCVLFEKVNMQDLEMYHGR